ncbi:MAG: nitroreductase, partial [Anaerolineae bacterium]|nr:nitroreductase [Anaerolineae bacterium]
FARKVSATHTETVPVVTATGYILDEPRARNGGFRKTIGAVKRLPWEQLFFKDTFDTPITTEEAGSYAEPLEMVRIGPSASNKQPWRIVKDGPKWHFYLQRSRRYGNTLAFKLVGIADIQRLDMGIAMNHFELTAQELGLQGQWVIDDPGIVTPNDSTEYSVSWIEN